MALGYIDSQAITDIADAIRAKDGSSSTMTIAEMPQKIADIPSGGGERPISDWKQVAIIDYDGTLIADYTRQEALALTALPTAPDHSQDELPLSFETYNWTLAEIKDQLTNHPQLQITAGALYRSTDTLSHAIFNMNDDRLSLHFQITRVSSDEYVDWGDGTTSSINQYGSTAHTYATQGTYHVKTNAAKMAFADGTWNEHSPVRVSFGTSVTAATAEFFNRFKETISLPMPNVPNIYSSTGNGNPMGLITGLVVPKTSLFNAINLDLYNVKVISLPPGWNESSNNQNMTYMRNLERLDFPAGFTKSIIQLGNTPVKNFTIPSTMNISQVCNNAFGMKKIVIEEGVTTLSSSVICDAYFCEEISLPSTLTTINNSAFNPRCVYGTIWIYAQTPPTMASSFNSYQKPKKVYIPYGTLSAYESAQYWSTWAGLYEEMPQTT